MLRILATIALTLGGWIVFFNWYSIYASRISGRFVSAIPLIGGALVVLGLGGFEQTRRYAWLGIVMDYGTLSLLLGVPMLLREAWQTSPVNLLHRFVSETGGHRDDIRLFRHSNFTIRRIHKPPVVCNEHGALVQSYGFVGKWHDQDGVLYLEGYAANRTVEIRRHEGTYVATEHNYPVDKKYDYDRLDGLRFTKVK